MEEEVIYHLGPNGISWPTDKTFENEESVKEIQDTVVFVNIKTLLRNALNAFDDRDNIANTKETIKDRIDSDIMLFKHYMRNSHNSDVIIYNVNYDNLRRDGLTKFMEPTTDKQRAYAEAMDVAWELTKEFIDQHFTKQFTNMNPTEIRNAYIMTNYAIDLLGSKSFHELKSLESFTGNIKSFAEFNHKLKIPKTEREHIPLTESTLRIFGDGDLFGAQPKAVRDKVIEIAHKSNWTPLTTESRVRFSINRYDKPLNDALANMVRS